MRIKWTRWASFALNDAAEYIAREDPRAARTFVSHVKKSVLQQLSRFPKSGRPGRVADTRELIPGKYPYIIAYRVQHGHVEILDVIHTARLWPDSFPEE